MGRDLLCSGGGTCFRARQDEANAAARDFLAAAEDEVPPTQGEANCLDVAIGERTVHIKLGSIASVKGETHDATLVVQTKLNSTSDVKTALSIAAEIQARPTSTTPLLLRAATNVFVGATRPRHLLCLAMPADDLKGKLLAAVAGWGWRIAPA